MACSSNGLFPDDTKPSPEPMLSLNGGPATFTWGQFHKSYPSHYSPKITVSPGANKLIWQFFLRGYVRTSIQAQVVSSSARKSKAVLTVSGHDKGHVLGYRCKTIRERCHDTIGTCRFVCLIEWEFGTWIGLIWLLDFVFVIYASHDDYIFGNKIYWYIISYFQHGKGAGTWYPWIARTLVPYMVNTMAADALEMKKTNKLGNQQLWMYQSGRSPKVVALFFCY